MRPAGSPGRARRGRALAAAALPVLLALTGAACGKKGPPQPPLRIRPSAPRALQVMQRGDTVWLTLKEPSRRTDGSELGQDAIIRIYLLPGSADPAGRLAPGKPAATVSPRRAGGPAWTIPRAQWGDYLVGERLEIPLSLDSLERAGLPPGATRKRQVAFMAEVQEGKRRRSELAGPAGLALCAAPPPPSSLSAAMTEEGVRLTWDPPGMEGVSARVYRGAGGEPPGDRPHAAAAAAGGMFLDRAVVDGQSYSYELRFAAGGERSLCESTAAAASARAQDTFPPAPPRGLAAAAEDDLIRLFWTPGPEPDLAGYLVYRRASEGSPFEKLTGEPIAETTYADEAVTSGTTYTYVVTALDGATPPNESGRSEPASETAR